MTLQWNLYRELDGRSKGVEMVQESFNGAFLQDAESVIDVSLPYAGTLKDS